MKSERTDPPPRTPNHKGSIAEEAIATEATKLGIIVSRPNIDARYDLVFDVGTSLLRVQCKWGSFERREGVIKVGLMSSWCTPTDTHGPPTKLARWTFSGSTARRSTAATSSMPRVSWSVALFI